MGKAITVTDGSFATDVLGSDLPILVDFWAEWCNPCKMIAPILEQIAVEHDGKLTIAKLDADTNPRTLGEFGVQGLPTLILFKGGKPVERIVGAMPKTSLLARIQKHI